MSGLVAAVRRRVPEGCVDQTCCRDNCSVSLKGAPTEHVLVDLDCGALQSRQQGKRCDYLFVGEEVETAWVVPIELKSGGFKAADVAEQLRGGAALAASWLPDGSAFGFVPVTLIRCGQPLRGALRPEVT